MSQAIISILLLEDDEAYASVLKRAMEKRDHVVVWVKDLSALNAVMQKSNTFDLILMDLKLEESTSLSSVQSVRDRYSEAKIFIVTAYASIATTVDAIKFGADDYLPKPITVDEILNAYYGKQAAQPTEGEFEQLSLKRLEWEQIQRVLKENDGNISRTAKQLNMHRRTLQRKLQKKPGS